VEGIFQKLLNTKKRTEEITAVEKVHGPIEEILEEKVKNQLERMKPNKAKGPDELYRDD